ncbi:MAG: hypothetical protein K1V78_00890 [Muribaculaceae bacterium]
MKHKKLSTLRRERAFIGTCLKIILRYERNGQSIPLQRVLAEAVATAPPCYNISIGRALDVFGRDGARLEEIASSERPGQWRDLARQVLDSMRGPRRMSFGKALVFNAVYNRPDSYYMSVSHARTLVRPYVTVGRNVVCKPVSINQ